MQSVSITTKTCEFESHSWWDVLDSSISYVIEFVSDLRQVHGFLQILQIPPPIKLDCHDIVEIFLKVVLNNYIIAITRKMMRCFITPNFSKNILGNICKILTTGILQIHVLKSKLPLGVNATELLGWYLMSNELNVDLLGYWYFKFNWQKLL